MKLPKGITPFFGKWNSGERKMSSGVVMKMRTVYILCASLLLIGAGYATFASRTSNNVPITFFSIDPRLSDQEQQTIAAWLENEQVLRPLQYAHTLKQQFPAIASVAITYPATSFQEVEVVGQEPKVRINAVTILPTQGPLLPAAAYQEHVLNELPNIAVHDVATIEHNVQGLRTFTEKIPASLFNRFSITWHSPTKIVFQNLQQPDMCIIADAMTIPSENCLNRCDTAYAEVKNQKKILASIPASKKASIMIDIRFEKQIITYVQSAEGG